MARGRLAAHAAYWLGRNGRPAERQAAWMRAQQRRARFRRTAVSLTRTFADDAQPIALIREPPNKAPAKDRPPMPRDARTHVSRENALPARMGGQRAEAGRSGLPACCGLYAGNAARRRLFREAGVWIARTGAPGHPRPAEYGQEHAVDHRCAARCDRGLGARRMQSAQDDPDLPAARLDSPIARAPQTSPANYRSLTGCP